LVVFGADGEGVESGKGIYMTDEESNPVSFVDMVLVLLEDRFPWLGNQSEAAVNGADTVDALIDLHASLLRQPTAHGRHSPSTSVSCGGTLTPETRKTAQ
jgi:hypothetical protein